jgi:hypothetical protein
MGRELMHEGTGPLAANREIGLYLLRSKCRSAAALAFFSARSVEISSWSNKALTIFRISKANSHWRLRCLGPLEFIDSCSRRREDVR